MQLCGTARCLLRRTECPPPAPGPWTARVRAKRGDSKGVRALAHPFGPGRDDLPYCYEQSARGAKRPRTARGPEGTFGRKPVIANRRPHPQSQSECIYEAANKKPPPVNLRTADRHVKVGHGGRAPYLVYWDLTMVQASSMMRSSLPRSLEKTRVFITSGGG